MENANKLLKFSQALFSASYAASEKMTAQKVEAIFELVKKYPLSELLLSIENHYLTSEFPIKPANIVKFIEAKRPKIENKASLIFKQILLKTSRTSNMNYSCPKIHYAISAIGGTRRISDSKIDEQVWIEKEFVKAYEDAETRNVSWEDVPKEFKSSYPGNFEAETEIVKINISLNKPVERKALPNHVDEERIDFNNRPEFIAYKKQLGAMLKKI